MALPELTVMSQRSEQLLKAPLPMLVTLAGIVMLVISELEKAELSIPVTLKP